MRRLDIGIASYGAPEKLQRTLSALRETARTNWRCYILHNPHPDGETEKLTRQVAEHAARGHVAIEFWPIEKNLGYAGSVNRFFELAETEYLAYLDNDAVPLTEGWDEQLCRKLDQFHEIGMIFPNGGAYEIDRSNYREIMWAPGFAWVLTRNAQKQTGGFDELIGHQEEADYCLRLRMEGFRCAALPTVHIRHCATATNDPAAQQRINEGVIRWMNKWVRYFCGRRMDYYSPNVLRWEEWPPNALYLEEWWKRHFPGTNSTPPAFQVEGRSYDWIRVPRLSGYYRGRII